MESRPGMGWLSCHIFNAICGIAAKNLKKDGQDNNEVI